MSMKSDQATGKMITNKAGIMVSALQRASEDDPVMAVAIAALSLAAIASAADISKAAVLEAIDIAWAQTAELRD